MSPEASKRPSGATYLHNDLLQTKALVSDLLDELKAQDEKHGEEIKAKDACIAELEANVAALEKRPRKQRGP